MITNLGVSLSRLALFSIISGSMNLVMLPFWGRMIDRFGNRPVLAIDMAAIGLLPLLWLFATPGNLAPIWIDAVLTGIFWSGFTLANFNIILASAPEEDRTAYLGAQNVAVGVSAFAAALVGGIVAAALANVSLRAGPLTLINFHLLFAASALLRLVLIPVALGLREERAGSVAAVLDFVGDEISQRFAKGLQAGVTLVRRIGTPGGR
jgi:MFS family permease